MKKKTKAPAPLPKVTLFVEVEHETWRKLTVLAATAGASRMSLYRVAIEYALLDKKFEDYVIKFMALRRKAETK